MDRWNPEYSKSCRSGCVSKREYIERRTPEYSRKNKSERASMYNWKDRLALEYLMTYSSKQANISNYLTQADSRKCDDKEEQRHKHSSTHTSEDNGGLPHHL